MAQAPSHPLPLTPPAAVYSPNPIRSQSPQIVEGHRPSEPRRTSSGNILQRRDLSASPQLPRTTFRGGLGRHIPAQVQIYPPDSSTYVEESNDTDHLSPILSRFPRRQLSADNMAGSNSRNVSSSSNVGLPSPAGSKSNDESPTETHEPLQYHHQLVQDRDRDLAMRASKLTVGAHSNGSTGDLSQLHMRSSSHLGADLQRPDSGFSSQSDQRGRALSPHVSPARPSSRNSRSPDGRLLGYVDLLNVPYPQPAPSGAENLMNEGLRTVIGENASLLSTRKTLDMYRMNVKKTNDPAIQYEFAIFMISAAQDEALQAAAEEERSSSSSQKSTTVPPVKNDLLKEAKHILQQLCDRSYPFAQYYLADGYASGLFTNGKPNLEKSFPLFLAASKHGHAEAGYRTALCYEYGWGCRVDAAKAVQFYQQAASKNHPGAMLRLGRACLTGEMGLVKKYKEGIRWLKRGSESADFQYNQAPFDLACLHEEGYGPDVFKDEPYAAQLYTKAAALGHKEAAFRLGEAYEYGQITCPRDPALSVHFYTGAAELGHPQAQMALCAWYMVGVEEVLEKDEGEAYEWARKAAELGLAKAQYTVGYFTEMGIGCRRDPLEANVWYVRAADQGEERAKHRISAIRAASAGADPMIAAQQKKKKTKKPVQTEGEGGGGKKVATTPAQEADKKKRFGLF